MTSINRTGAHRKNAPLVPRSVQVGHIAGAVILALALAAITLALFAVPSANASSHRPYWDGKSPKVWTSSVDPMCSWLNVHHIGLMRLNGETYYAECLPEGPKSDTYSWSLVSL